MKQYGLFGFLIASSAFSVYAADNTDLEVGLALDQGLSAVIEMDNTYRVTVGNDGAAFDYMLKRGKFDSEAPLDWYVGVGAWAEWEDEFGVRVPLGVKVNFYDGWNAYAQVHPELDLYAGPELQLGGAVGITYKF